MSNVTVPGPGGNEPRRRNGRWGKRIALMAVGVVTGIGVGVVTGDAGDAVLAGAAVLSAARDVIE